MPFIAFDGIDGSGKGTLIELVMEELTKRHVHALLTKQPGGSKVGNKIRDILFSDPTTKEIDDTAIEFLFAASAVHAAKEIVKPALEAGMFVVSDRHWPSAKAYGELRKSDPRAKHAYVSIMQELDQTDILFLLIGDPEKLLARAQARVTETHQAGKKWDNVIALAEIQDNFLREFATHPKVVVIDTTWETPERLFQYQIWPRIQNLLGPRRCIPGKFVQVPLDRKEAA